MRICAGFFSTSKNTEQKEKISSLNEMMLDRLFWRLLCLCWTRALNSTMEYHQHLGPVFKSLTNKS